MLDGHIDDFVQEGRRSGRQPFRIISRPPRRALHTVYNIQNLYPNEQSCSDLPLIGMLFERCIMRF
jgi:hypothetical protein